VPFSEYLLNNDAIALQADAADWQDAIRIGVELLERAGAVDARYYRGILDNVQANGPYFVLMPGVAMPHARPEDGGLATGFSLVTLARPVAFGHSQHDPVDVVICIAAADRAALNQEVIVEIMTLLDYEPAIARLREARSLDDLRKLFAELPEEN
jgi:ascorbate PTS system EIIA or EIIAB component